jgi:excisionase family DNA binding protein
MTMEALFDRSPAATQDPDRASPLCVRTDRAMAMLGIGKTKLYELMAAGELETINIGRRRLVLLASIDSFVERLRQRSP